MLYLKFERLKGFGLVPIKRNFYRGMNNNLPAMLRRIFIV